MAHVAGFVLVNDCPSVSSTERGGHGTRARAAIPSRPLGPAVTPDELAMCTPWPIGSKSWLPVQNGSTANLIFGIPKLISYISQFMTLHPGDLISTGTPAGVGLGQKPSPWYLKAGDQMRLGIEGLGEQTQTCASAP